MQPLFRKPCVLYSCTAKWETSGPVLPLWQYLTISLFFIYFLLVPDNLTIFFIICVTFESKLSDVYTYMYNCKFIYSYWLWFSTTNHHIKRYEQSHIIFSLLCPTSTRTCNRTTKLSDGDKISRSDMQSVGKNDTDIPQYMVDPVVSRSNASIHCWWDVIWLNKRSSLCPIEVVKFVARSTQYHYYLVCYLCFTHT